MSENFKVSIESPQSGFMSVSLAGDGRRFVTAFAHAPYDSLRDLLGGLTALLSGGGEKFLVRWNCEPEEYDFEFAARRGDDAPVDFRVVRYPDHRRRAGEAVFKLSCPRLDFCHEFWRELRELRRRSETDVFEQNWRREFPHEELRRFTTVLRDFKRKSAAAAAIEPAPAPAGKSPR